MLVSLEPGVVVLRRTTPGGVGPAPVVVQLDVARARLGEQARRLE